LLSDKEIEDKIRNGNFSDIVACADNKKGCPETVWDGPYSYRCSLGINKCARHGNFPVKTEEKKDGIAGGIIDGEYDTPNG
jgi:hypothetical protein